MGTAPAVAFHSDSDEWLVRRMSKPNNGFGEWTLMGNDMLIYPVMPAGQSVTFAYLDKNCVKLFKRRQSAISL